MCNCVEMCEYMYAYVYGSMHKEQTLLSLTSPPSPSPCPSLRRSSGHPRIRRGMTIGILRVCFREPPISTIIGVLGSPSL